MDDFFCKKILENIYKLYTDKNAYDLISEELSNKTNTEKSPKKSKKKKKKLSISSDEYLSNEMDNKILISSLINQNNNNKSKNNNKKNKNKNSKDKKENQNNQDNRDNYSNEHSNDNSHDNDNKYDDGDFILKTKSEPILDYKRKVMSSSEDDFEVKSNNNKNGKLNKVKNGNHNKDMKLYGGIDNISKFELESNDKLLEINGKDDQSDLNQNIQNNISKTINKSLINNNTENTVKTTDQNSLLNSNLIIEKAESIDFEVNNNKTLNDTSKDLEPLFKKNTKKKVKKHKYQVETTTLTISKSKSSVFDINLGMDKKSIPGTSWKGASLKPKVVAEIPVKPISNNININNVNNSSHTNSNHTNGNSNSNGNHLNILNNNCNLLTISKAHSSIELDQANNCIHIENVDNYNNTNINKGRIEEFNKFLGPPLFSYNENYCDLKNRENKQEGMNKSGSTNYYNSGSIYNTFSMPSYNDSSSNYNKNSYKKFDKIDNRYQKSSNKYNSRSNNYYNDASNEYNLVEKERNNNEGKYYLINNTININNYNNYNKVEEPYNKHSDYNEYNEYNEYHNHHNNNYYYRPYSSNNYNSGNYYKSDYNYRNDVGQFNHNTSKYTNSTSTNVNTNNTTINIMEKINKKIYPFTFYYRLHNDILDYSNSINERLNVLKDLKLYIIKYLEDIIKNSLNFNMTVEVYGSFATDLQIESSDIDFTIHPVGEDTEEYNTNDIIQNISKVLINFDDFEEVNPILTATVPIIKLV